MNMEQHRVDLLSFLFGALFLAFAASVMWNVNFDFGFDIGAWILPVTVLVIGIALLASGVRTALQRNGKVQ